MLYLIASKIRSVSRKFKDKSNTSDYIEFYGYNNAGGRTAQSEYTNWCGFRLS